MKLTVNKEALIKALERVSFCLPKSKEFPTKSRHIHAEVISKQIEFAGTDAHRISVARLPIKNSCRKPELLNFDEHVDLLKALKAARGENIIITKINLGKDKSILFGSEQVCCFATKLLDEDYMQYRRVIAGARYEVTSLIHKSQLVSLLKGVRKPIKLSLLAAELTIEEESINGDYQQIGAIACERAVPESAGIILDPVYLHQALMHIGSPAVRISMISAKDPFQGPVKIEGIGEEDEWEHHLMPQRP